MCPSETTGGTDCAPELHRTAHNGVRFSFRVHSSGGSLAACAGEKVLGAAADSVEHCADREADRTGRLLERADGGFYVATRKVD